MQPAVIVRFERENGTGPPRNRKKHGRREADVQMGLERYVAERHPSLRRSSMGGHALLLAAVQLAGEGQLVSAKRAGPFAEADERDAVALNPSVGNRKRSVT